MLIEEVEFVESRHTPLAAFLMLIFPKGLD
jgi:hypothetical protein